MSAWVLLVGFLSFVISVVASSVAGDHIALLQDESRPARMAVVLSMLTLVASVTALAISLSVRSPDCNSVNQEDVASTIGLFTALPILVAFFTGIGAIVGTARRARVSVFGVGIAGLAGCIDVYAVGRSINLCLNSATASSAARSSLP